MGEVDRDVVDRALLGGPFASEPDVALPQIGDTGQDRLRNASALIVGLGGLGSVASLYLANAGIGKP